MFHECIIADIIQTYLQQLDCTEICFFNLSFPSTVHQTVPASAK